MLLFMKFNELACYYGIICITYDFRGVYSWFLCAVQKEQATINKYKNNTIFRLMYDGGTTYRKNTNVFYYYVLYNIHFAAMLVTNPPLSGILKRCCSICEKNWHFFYFGLWWFQKAQTAVDKTQSRKIWRWTNVDTSEPQRYFNSRMCSQ